MLLLALAPLALALPADERWLATDHLAVGLAADGSLGNAALGLGLVVDPDGVAGPYPHGGDVLTPGRLWETWAAQADQGEWTMADPGGTSALDLAWEPPWDDGWLTWARGTGATDAFLVDLTVVAPWGSPVLWTVLDLTATRDLTGLWLAKTYDPDLDAPLTGTYTTANAALDGAVVASGAFDGRAWALAAVDGQGGICDWCALPAEVLAGVSSSTADDQLGLAVEVGALATGETVRVLYAYGFGTDADAALATALDAATSRDLDADGADWDLDCDDLDALVGPDAAELPGTGVDEDCDGLVDEEEEEGGDTGWEDRDDWDEPIPDEEEEEGDGGTDGGGTDDGGTDGGDTDGDTDGGSAGAPDTDDDDGKSGGCATSPAPATLLALLLAPLALRRRTP